MKQIKKGIIDYSQLINVVNENLEDYNPTKKGKVLIVFDHMIADMEANEKSSLIVTELFMGGRKYKIFNHNLFSKSLEI